MIKDVPYHYPGDEVLANQLVEAGKKANIPVEGVYGESFRVGLWDNRSFTLSCSKRRHSCYQPICYVSCES